VEVSLLLYYTCMSYIYIKYRYKKIFPMLRKDMLADIVPVDIPINLMCCVAWR
jgi:hypothetical protein